MSIKYQDSLFKLNNIQENILFNKKYNIVLDLTDTKFKQESIKAVVDYINEGTVPIFSKDIIELADYLMLDNLLKEIKKIASKTRPSIYSGYNIYSLCEFGHFEVVNLLKNQDWSEGLYGACAGGHLEIVNLMIQKGASYWDLGLYGACRGGHLEIAELMLSKGANNWNKGLYHACKGGHLNLAELMIQKGANNWKYGLEGACEGGHLELVELMLSKGANENSSINILKDNYKTFNKYYDGKYLKDKFDIDDSIIGKLVNN